MADCVPRSGVSTVLLPKLPISDAFQAEYLEYNRILPLEVTGDRLRVAVAGQAAQEVLEDLELSYGVPLELIPVSHDELLESIRRTFAASESVLELIKDLDAELGPSRDNSDDGLADARGTVSTADLHQAPEGSGLRRPERPQYTVR